MLCEQRCECAHLKLILSIITVQREQVGSDVLNNIHLDCFIEKLYSLSDEEYPKSIPITHAALSAYNPVVEIRIRNWLGVFLKSDIL